MKWNMYRNLDPSTNRSCSKNTLYREAMMLRKSANSGDNSWGQVSNSYSLSCSTCCFTYMEVTSQISTKGLTMSYNNSARFFSKDLLKVRRSSPQAALCDSIRESFPISLSSDVLYSRWKVPSIQILNPICVIFHSSEAREYYTIDLVC